MLIQRSILEPIRSGLSTIELWKAEDQGLIACWERGREVSLEQLKIAERAKRGELVPLPWKGGLERIIKLKRKYGTHRYLAMWQGLRDDDLNIDTNKEQEITCARSKTTIVFTSDSTKYADA